MSKDTSGPAYPCLERGGNGLDLTHPGMTLRQWHAGLAMQGMLCNGFIPHMVKPEGSVSQSYNYAQAAFAMADAMIAEGSK